MNSHHLVNGCFSLAKADVHPSFAERDELAPADPVEGYVGADDSHDLPPVYDHEEVRVGLLRAHQRSVQMVRRRLHAQLRQRRRPRTLLRSHRLRERRARSRRPSRRSSSPRPARSSDPEPPGRSRASSVNLVGPINIQNPTSLVASATGARRRSHV